MILVGYPVGIHVLGILNKELSKTCRINRTRSQLDLEHRFSESESERNTSACGVEWAEQGSSWRAPCLGESCLLDLYHTNGI